MSVRDRPFRYDRTQDPHRDRDDVHYRLYLGRDGEPAVICVQWFDYLDYEDARFLSYDAYPTEEAAEAELRLLRPATAPTVRVTVDLAWGR